MSLNASVDDPLWTMKLVILEDTLVRVYFEPGYTIQANDYVVFLNKYVTDANPGQECRGASSVSITNLEENPKCARASTQPSNRGPS